MLIVANLFIVLSNFGSCLYFVYWVSSGQRAPMFAYFNENDWKKLKQEKKERCCIEKREAVE